MKNTSLLVISLVVSTIAPAQADTLDMRYRITLAGLSLGTATMSGQMSPDKYQLNLRAQLNGLVGMVVSGSGAADGAGAINAGHIFSNGYSLSASNSSMTRTIRMSLSRANVDKVAIDPPFDEHPDRIPITEVNKKGVVDPIGALVMPIAGNPMDPANCNRTLPVYDSAQRFNVTLSYIGTKDVKIRGYTGPVLICAARYTPIAGHRPNRKQTVFMAQNRDMSAWLMPVSNTGVLVPFRISVKTQVGTSVIEADAFNAAK